MIFPFEVNFTKKLAIDPATNCEEILLYIKKNLVRQTPYLRNYKINNKIFSFKADFWGVGRGTDFAGVSKGWFEIMNENNSLAIEYRYRIGSNMIIVPMLYGIVALLLLIKDFKKYLSFIPMITGLTIAVEIVFWVVSYFVMKDIFKQIIVNLESNFKQTLA